MIRSALTHITGHLNDFLKREFDATEDLVVLSDLVEQDGAIAPNADSGLGVFLVNIERDSSVRRPGRGFPERQAAPPHLHLDLHVMVVAHSAHGKYAEGLDLLSHAIEFLHDTPLLNRANTPGLDERIEHLILEVENLSLENLATLWGVLGGRYLPSVMYRVRIVGSGE